MTPNRPTHPGHDARKRRTAAAILGAARELFAELEFRAVTVEQIAGRAAVSVGSVYVHFGSKEGLYLSVVEDAVAMSDHYLRSRRWSDSPLQRIFNAGEAYVAFAVDHPAAFRLVSVQLPTLGELPELAARQAHLSGRITAQLAHLSVDVRAAIDAGEVSALPVRHVLTYLWASWSGVIAMSQRDDEFRINPSDVSLILRAAGAALATGIAPSDQSTISCADGRAASRAA